MTNKKLIEETFPLRETSIDAVHEKNVRHGHISTLHIWPARRPLAAARAALIAALLDDPGNDAEREVLKKKIGGEIVRNPKTGREETEGGILHWGREKSEDVAWFREKIRAQYGGAPKVLDMFAGGGAIPLEAMRLGCDVTAIDYNPVAWFLLKCTLDYPHRLAGKKWPLPPSDTLSSVTGEDGRLIDVPNDGEGDLAAHVRWWGRWVLERARKDLEEYYPTEPRDPSRPANKENNPLCPTVAYLWARTIPHPDPRKRGLRVPLLKTMWLCKKKGDDSVEEGEDGVGRRKSIAKKRALKMHYNAEANKFEFEIFEPKDDSEVGAGTMQRGGVQCPSTGDEDALSGGAFIKMDKIQEYGKIGDLGAVCTAVVISVPSSTGKTSRKEYRLPTERELEAAKCAQNSLEELYAQIPHGQPTEPIDPPDSRAVFVQLYGIDEYRKLFTDRQLLALGTFIKHTRIARIEIEKMLGSNGSDLSDAVTAYLSILVDRLANYISTICIWDSAAEEIKQTFLRFALPITWDFAEGNPISTLGRLYVGALDSVNRVLENIDGYAFADNVTVINDSAVEYTENDKYDAIVTDPPYYDAIPYADLSDFFYVWLKRSVGDYYKTSFAPSLTPKAGELVQHPNRDGGKVAARIAYENGMAQAFSAACKALKPSGRMVIVFAHKNPDAWETLVSAMIRAGFTITASWPIDTEMGGGIRNHNRASLSSSVWLVCRKRPVGAGRGNLKNVRAQMQERITERLKYFWDLNVKGPDLLWAAIGPGLEAYSAYDTVTNLKGEAFTVKDFIAEVRRVTTDFALGRILQGGNEGLDETTRYALMHAEYFGMAPAPVGECILLSGAYGLELSSLTGQRGILTKAKASKAKKTEDDDSEAESESGGGSGSDLRLLRWDERKQPDLGEPHPTHGLPYVDMLHRLLREWDTGDAARPGAYIARNGLAENELFWRVAQAFAELPNTPERSKIDALIQLGKGNVRYSATLYETELKAVENAQQKLDFE